MEWILQNVDQLFMVLTSIVAASSAIAALTPTPKDDGVVRFIRKLLDILALNIGNAKKQHEFFFIFS